MASNSSSVCSVGDICAHHTVFIRPCMLFFSDQCVSIHASPPLRAISNAGQPCRSTCVHLSSAVIASFTAFRTSLSVVCLSSPSLVEGIRLGACDFRLQVTDVGAVMLFDASLGSSTIQTIDLRGNQLTMRAGRTARAVMIDHDCLRAVDMRQNCALKLGLLRVCLCFFFCAGTAVAQDSGAWYHMLHCSA